MVPIDNEVLTGKNIHTYSKKANFCVPILHHRLKPFKSFSASLGIATDSLATSARAAVI